MNETVDRVISAFSELEPYVSLPNDFDRGLLVDILDWSASEFAKENQLREFERDAKWEHNVGASEFLKLIDTYRTPKAIETRVTLAEKTNKHLATLSNTEEETVFLEQLADDIAGLGPRLDRLAEMVEGAKLEQRRERKSLVREPVCIRLGRYYVEQTGGVFSSGTWDAGKPQRKASGACFVYAAISVLSPEHIHGLQNLLRGLSDTINKN